MHLKTIYIHHQQPKDFIDRSRNMAKIVMDKQMLQVSGRGGGEVLDLNPKTVDTFYPSPRKAARASRLQNQVILEYSCKLMKNIQVGRSAE